MNVWGSKRFSITVLVGVTAALFALTACSRGFAPVNTPSAAATIAITVDSTQSATLPSSPPDQSTTCSVIP